MITTEQTAEIRRLYYAEHWTIGTIAAQFGLHPDTVRAAVATDRFNRARLSRPRLTDPYEAFIRETLALYPRLRATRIAAMIRERGYTGSVVQVRRLVARLRPAFQEAFVQRRTFPGEEAQVDWAHFGEVQVGRARRKLSCFSGVKSLIGQGIADPARVCIAGASYGGYAALAGAVFTPDLYACAISINGVSDLPAMLDFVVARALKKDPAVRYQDADEMAADLHTCLAELRSRESNEPVEGSKTLKLGDSEPTVGAPPASAIVTDTRLPVSRHFDCTAALRRLSKSNRSGRAPRPVSIFRRIISDAPARRLFIFSVLAAAAGGFIAYI